LSNSVHAWDRYLFDVQQQQARKKRNSSEKKCLMNGYAVENLKWRWQKDEEEAGMGRRDRGDGGDGGRKTSASRICKSSTRTCSQSASCSICDARLPSSPHPLATIPTISRPTVSPMCAEDEASWCVDAVLGKSLLVLVAGHILCAPCRSLLSPDIISLPEARSSCARDGASICSDVSSCSVCMP